MTTEATTKTQEHEKKPEKAQAAEQKAPEQKSAHAQSGNQKPGKKKGGGGGQPQLTREQRVEQKIARQMDLVKNANYAAVPRRALETNAFIALINKNDYLVNRLRDRLAYDQTIDVAKAVTALQKNQEIRKELNALNAEICKIMSLDYEPPRGFEVSSQEESGKKAA